MPILGGTLVRYFGLRFLSAVLLVFAGIFVLVALLDYIELMRRAERHPQCLGDPGGEDLVLPRAAGDRARAAVLRADRRHVVLSQSVAAARTGDRALGRHVGLAIHLAGAGGGLPARHLRHHDLQPDRRRPARSSPSATKPSCSAADRGNSPAADAPFWASQRTAEGQAIINAKPSRDQGVSLTGVTVIHLDGANHFKQRIEARAAVLEPGAWRLQRCPHLRAWRAAGRAGRLPAQDQPDAGTGARKFCHTRNCAVLGTSAVYQDRRTRRACRRRL